MNPFHFISRYFWAISLAFSCFNYLAATRRLNATADAERIRLGQHYLRWFAISGTVPWLVMGVGQIVGATPTVWYYFRPQDRNPFVIAWLASLFLLSVFFAIWVFAADGARKTRELELLSAIGMRSRKPMSEFFIKLFAAIGPAFVLLWALLVVSMNAQIPVNAL